MRDGLVLGDVDGVALLVVELVGQLRVVLDVRNADLCVVAVKDAGNFLESGAPVEDLLGTVMTSGLKSWAGTYLVST